ncbi:S-adenosyl-L-methionine-dependent methyltransferase, partial [Melanomma pulvis-pyrius CBS 109.77]
YGEVTPAFVEALLRDFSIGKTSSVVDLGSGVGNVVLQAYLATGCRALGCEIDGARHAAASQFRDAVAGALQPTVPAPRGAVRTNDMGTGRELQDAVVLRRGDIFEDWVTLARVQSADLVFSDNLKFGPELVGRQVDSVLARMKPGAVFVSLEKVVRGRGCARVLAALGVTEERRVSERGAVSWADKKIEYWVYR